MRGAETIDKYIALPQQEAFDIEYWLLEEAKLQRMPAEKELARLVELKETRTVRWNTATALHQAASDWVLRGVPANCVIETVED